MGSGKRAYKAHSEAQHYSILICQQKMPDSESNAEKGMSLTEKNGSAAATEPTETQKQQLQIQQQQPQGLSQSSKDDIGVCVVIISITILAIIITIIKIVLFDISAYPELFSSGSSSDSTTLNTTTIPSAK